MGSLTHGFFFQPNVHVENTVFTGCKPCIHGGLIFLYTHVVQGPLQDLSILEIWYLWAVRESIFHVYLGMTLLSTV